MLDAIAIVPSAPVLVPELTGAGAAAELNDLRAAVRAAAKTLPPHWVAVGVGATEAVLGPDAAGTFAGFGVDVPVRLAPDAVRAADLPLCALLTGWLREQTHPAATAEVRVYGPDADVEAGRRLRTEIDAAPEPIGVLVVADGANTLTPAAPGGHHPDDVAVQRALDDALAAGDTAALALQPDRVVGRVAWAVLAGLAEPGPRAATVLYRGAPYGVGYLVGVWRP